jgi:short-subunit dehydrogenase
MLATYSGTKAFIAAFTTALAEETRAHNVVVENLNTYFVVSPILSLLFFLSALLRSKEMIIYRSPNSPTFVDRQLSSPLPLPTSVQHYQK